MKVLPYTCKRADPKSSHPGTPGAGTAYCKPPALPPLYTYPSTTSSFLSTNLPQKANHHPPPNFPLEMHPISSTNCTNFQWKFTPISSANSSNFQCKFQRKRHGKAAPCYTSVADGERGACLHRIAAYSVSMLYWLHESSPAPTNQCFHRPLGSRWHNRDEKEGQQKEIAGAS